MTREEKIIAILDKEVDEGTELIVGARWIAMQMLFGEKGFSADEVKRDVYFQIDLDNETATSRVDYLIAVDDRPAMVIKCAPGSLNSRERQVLAAARIVESRPVPVAVVMDPHTAIVLDGLTGRVTGEGFDAIPERDHLARMMASVESASLTPERVEREKRVLLAFDAIRCSIPKGDGGIALPEGSIAKES